ncbi:MAG: hypothetical protein ACYCQI_09975, partial [Gammaproteobacteria bacterium]
MDLFKIKHIEDEAFITVACRYFAGSEKAAEYELIRRRNEFNKTFCATLERDAKNDNLDSMYALILEHVRSKDCDYNNRNKHYFNLLASFERCLNQKLTNLKESKAPSPTVDLKGLKLLFSSEWEIAKPLHKDLIKKTHELFIKQ